MTRLRPRLLLLGTLSLALLATGPMASAVSADSNAPTILTEPIDDTNVHEEPDGTTIASRTVGTRTSQLFPDGRLHQTESYTVHQVSRTATGQLIYDSTTTTEQKVILEGEEPTLFQSTSSGTMTWGDGRVCALSSVLFVVNGKVIRSEFFGPDCD